MNNLTPYYTFINKCKNKKYKNKTHKHHIIPIYEGGTDDKSNLIKLSYLDHFKAHTILAYCYDINTKQRAANLQAANILTSWINGTTSVELWLKSRKFRISGWKHTKSTKIKMSNSSKDKPKSEMHKKNTSIGLKEYFKSHSVVIKGKTYEEYYGKAEAQIKRNKISQAQIGNKKHCVSITINGDKFNSHKEACEYFNITPYELLKKINGIETSYKNSGHSRIKTKINGIEYDSELEASKILNISARQVKKLNELR